MPERPDGGLARSLNAMLSQLGARCTASADAAAAARAATDRMAGPLGRWPQLRRPVSLLHGQAEHWAHRDDRGAQRRPGPRADQIAPPARAEALLADLDEADEALFTDPVREDPGKIGQ